MSGHDDVMKDDLVRNGRDDLEDDRGLALDLHLVSGCDRNGCDHENDCDDDWKDDDAMIYASDDDVESHSCFPNLWFSQYV